MRQLSVSQMVTYGLRPVVSVAVAGVDRTCAKACGGLTTTAASTNLYDVSVEAKVALGDLLALNAGEDSGVPVPTGTTLVRPCYPGGSPHYQGARTPLLCCRPGDAFLPSRICPAVLAWNCVWRSSSKPLLELSGALNQSKPMLALRAELLKFSQQC